MNDVLQLLMQIMNGCNGRYLQQLKLNFIFFFENSFGFKIDTATTSRQWASQICAAHCLDPSPGHRVADYMGQMVAWGELLSMSLSEGSLSTMPSPRGLPGPCTLLMHWIASVETNSFP